MQWVIDIIYGRVLDFFKYFADLHDYKPAAGEMIIGDGDVWTHQPWIDWRDTAENLSTTGHGHFKQGIDVDNNIDLDGNNLLNVNDASIVELTLHAGLGNSYIFGSRGGNKTVINDDDGQNNIFEYYTSKGDGTQTCNTIWHLRGLPDPHTNLETFRVNARPAAFNQFYLFSHATGTGVVRPVSLGAGTFKEHLKCQADDDTEMNEGPMDHRWAMANSTKDPTTDAPADWIEVKINGTVRYLPAYAA